MNIKKSFVLLLLLVYSSSASAIIFTLVRFMVGGGFLTGAYYAFEETQKEYARAHGRFSKQCKPITRQDFDSTHKEELEKKCLCYREKYKKVIPMALLTVVSGGIGSRLVAKGIFKGILK